MSKNMDVALLFDFYGEMLTEKQRDVIEQYYNQDLSLSEIAENAGISRQGVRDSVKRAELQLFEMEERLGLAARLRDMNAALSAIAAAADAISEENDRQNGSLLIRENATRIAALTATLIERN